MRIDELKDVRDVMEKLPNRFKRAVGRLPEGMQYSFALWIFFGHNDGGNFLNAVLNNELTGFYQCADDSNVERVYDFVMWLHNDVPLDAWREKNLESWERQGGLLGLFKEQGFEEITDEGGSAPGGGS